MRLWVFLLPIIQNQPASRLNVLGNAAALFCEQHIAVSIGKPNLVIAREAVFNVIESEAVFGLVLPRCNAAMSGALFLLLKVLFWSVQWSGRGRHSTGCRDWPTSR